MAGAIFGAVLLSLLASSRNNIDECQDDNELNSLAKTAYKLALRFQDLSDNLKDKGVCFRVAYKNHLFVLCSALKYEDAYNVKKVNDEIVVEKNNHE